MKTTDERPPGQNPFLKNVKSAGQNGVSILVVEDDIDLAEVVSDVLQNEGYTIAHALNGQEAIEILNLGFEPDVIFLDLTMSILDGMGFLRARQMGAVNGVGKDAPVVIMSALDPMPGWILTLEQMGDLHGAQQLLERTPRDRISEKGMGALPWVTWLRKPFRIDQMLVTIRNITEM